VNWNNAQLAVIGQHVASFAAGGVAIAVALHFVSEAQGGMITESLNSIWDGVIQISKGVAGLAAVATSVYTTLKATNSASPASQIRSVVTNLSASDVTQAANSVADPAGRNKLISAVASMPEVRGIVAPEVVVLNTESPKVVNTPQAIERLPLGVPRQAA
jgi:hypothetical protein